MATNEFGDEIRQVMTERGMTEEHLIEGCKQILDDHETAQAALAADQERNRMRAISDEVARQARSAGDPRDNLMDSIMKNLRGG